MASLVPEYRSRFADSLVRGSVFSLYRDGSEPVYVSCEPEKIKNMIGYRSHVLLWVRPYLGPDEEASVDDGRMIFSPANVVYVRRVADHPDGPECPPPPQPVKQEPTDPRIYVQNLRGKQGYIRQMARQDDRLVVAQVQWFVPGAQPVWTDMSMLKVIPPEDVERCPHGQTRDECGSGENQCELCLQDEDEEGDMIEESMGLR